MEINLQFHENYIFLPSLDADSVIKFISRDVGLMCLDVEDEGSQSLDSLEMPRIEQESLLLDSARLQE